MLQLGLDRFASAYRALPIGVVALTAGRFKEEATRHEITLLL